MPTPTFDFVDETPPPEAGWRPLARALAETFTFPSVFPDSREEEAFRAQHALRFLAYRRAALVMGTLFWVVFTFWDVLFFLGEPGIYTADVLIQVLLSRVILIVSLMAILSPITFTPRFENESTATVSTIVGGIFCNIAVLVQVFFLVPQPINSAYYLPGLYINSFFLFAFAHLRARPAFLAGLISFLLLIGCSLGTGQLREQLIVVSMTYFVTLLVGHGVCVKFERAARDRFRHESDLRALVIIAAQKREEAEHANFAKTRFLASASHDLRQPMHTISLLVGLLRSRVAQQESAALVEKIDISVQTMQALFGNLLDISKLDAGIIQPAMRTFPIQELLDWAETQYEPQAASKGLVLRVLPCSLMIKSDPALLSQVVGNLVDNAIRYTPQGRIVVGCRRREHHVELLVIDTGIGIPTDRKTDVFDEFVQIGNAERDRRKGLGLGLSIVKRVAEVLGHGLRLESTVERGAAFSILLPRQAMVEPLPESREAPHSAASLGNTFIVVVDDELDNREATVALCESWGAHVVSGASAAEALHTLRQHLRPPDLIISDYRLGDGLNGLMAVQELRAFTQQDTPAIIVSGDTAAADLQQIRDAGMPMLHKPVSVDELRKQVQILLADAPR